MIKGNITQLLEQYCTSFRRYKLNNHTKISDRIHQNESHVFLEKGAVKVKETIGEKSFILMFLKEREIPRLLFINRDYKNSFENELSYETVKDSVLITIDRNEFDEKMKTHDFFREYMLMNHEIQYETILEKLKIKVHLEIKDQIFEYIKELASILETDRISVSHVSIAKDLNCSRTTLLKAFKELEKEEKISVMRKYIQLK